MQMKEKKELLVNLFCVTLDFEEFLNMVIRSNETVENEEEDLISKINNLSKKRMHLLLLEEMII